MGHIAGLKLFAVLLHNSIYSGQIVIAGLHCPDFIAPGGKGLFGVALHAYVDQEREPFL